MVVAVADSAKRVVDGVRADRGFVFVLSDGEGIVDSISAGRAGTRKSFGFAFAGFGSVSGVIGRGVSAGAVTGLAPMASGVGFDVDSAGTGMCSMMICPS